MRHYKKRRFAELEPTREPTRDWEPDVDEDWSTVTSAGDLAAAPYHSHSPRDIDFDHFKLQTQHTDELKWTKERPNTEDARTVLTWPFSANATAFPFYKNNYNWGGTPTTAYLQRQINRLGPLAAGQPPFTIFSDLYRWRELFRFYCVQAIDIEFGLVIEPYDTLDYTEYLHEDPAGTELNTNFGVHPAYAYPYTTYRTPAGMSRLWYPYSYPYYGHNFDYHKLHSWDEPLSTTLAIHAGTVPSYCTSTAIAYEEAFGPGGVARRAPMKTITIRPTDVNIGIVKKRPLQTKHTVWLQEQVGPHVDSDMNQACYGYKASNYDAGDFTANNGELRATSTPADQGYFTNNEFQLWHHHLFCNFEGLINSGPLVELKRYCGTTKYYDDSKNPVAEIPPTEQINMTWMPECMPYLGASSKLHYDQEAQATSHYCNFRLIGRWQQYVTFFGHRDGPQSLDETLT